MLETVTLDSYKIFKSYSIIRLFVDVFPTAEISLYSLKYKYDCEGKDFSRKLVWPTKVRPAIAYRKLQKGESR
jgi:hypothetical protein